MPKTETGRGQKVNEFLQKDEGYTITDPWDDFLD